MQILNGATISSIAVALVTLTSASAYGQTSGQNDVGFIGVSGAYQQRNQDFSSMISADQYGEQAEYASQNTLGGGGVFEVGAGVRVWENLSASLSFTHFSTTGSAEVVGSVPHPLFFNRPRAVTFEEPILDHSQLGYHLQARYAVPVAERLSASLFAGPSMIRLHQEVVGEVGITEIGDSLEQITTMVGAQTTATSTSKKTVFGFNVGVDLIYRLTDALGGTFTLRYVGATVDLSDTDPMSAVDLGGLHVGGGIRLFF